jgi:hypothetical protein
MKDKDGFTVRCENTQWRIYDNRDNHDYMCDIYGIHCHGDDHCEHYRPEVKEEQDGQTE